MSEIFNELSLIKIMIKNCGIIFAEILRNIKWKENSSNILYSQKDAYESTEEEKMCFFG